MIIKYFRLLLKLSAEELVYLEKMNRLKDCPTLGVNLTTCPPRNREQRAWGLDCLPEWNPHIRARLWNICKLKEKFLLWLVYTELLIDIEREVKRFIGNLRMNFFFISIEWLIFDILGVFVRNYQVRTKKNWSIFLSYL